AASEDAATTASEDAATTASDAWHAVLRTPFVVAFDRTVVPIAEAPRDWIDVLHHAWYDGVRVMDPAGTKEGAYFAGAVLVEALRDDDDLVRGFDWLARLDEQVDLYVAGTDELIGALERGDALLAILPMADAERARAERAPWLHYRVPSSGTPALTLGVAIVQGAAHADAARAFVDYLGTTGAATAAKLRTRWDPVAGSVDESVLPPDFELVDRWTAYPLAVDTLIAELPGWIERWEEEVRTR
ncbi:MAG: extracellular solute-binding protein, partial [Gammaproteobacteria bacterium]|nr:extracellular solute-binding protein [Gemmatimonadota bacterium]NIR39213.1 extracellular solute-binding protein [Actinomycetota bacterium]NIU77308.1 extracellular solute-binding protein [Gammaproteobacteria bacterium]NIY10895.1 extracellular solute-binding protein [Gemmatimonadota bacterium]